MMPIASIKSLTRARLVSARLAGLSTASLAVIAVLLSACNPGKAALDTNVPLKPAPDLNGAATPGVLIWRSPDLAERERMGVAYLIPPATVYRGKGSNFADLSPEQVDQIAAGLTKEVRAEVARHFRVVNAAGPGVTTLDLILVKVTPPGINYVGSGPYEISELAVGMPNAGGTTAGTLTISGKFVELGQRQTAGGVRCTRRVRRSWTCRPRALRRWRWTFPRRRASSLQLTWSARWSARDSIVSYRRNKLLNQFGPLGPPYVPDRHKQDYQLKHPAIVWTGDKNE